MKSTHRKKQSIATHQKIYQTSLKLFYKKGYEKVTVSEICRKSGVSLGTFYIHFKSKDAVVLEYFMSINKFVLTEVVPQIAKIDNRVDKLKCLFLAVFQYMNNLGKDFMKVIMQSQISAEKKSPVMAAERGTLFDTLYSLIDDCLKSGLFKSEYDALEITRFTLMSFRGVLYEWCLKDGSFDLIEEGEKAAQIVLNGLIA